MVRLKVFRVFRSQLEIGGQGQFLAVGLLFTPTEAEGIKVVPQEIWGPYDPTLVVEMRCDEIGEVEAASPRSVFLPFAGAKLPLPPIHA